MDTPASLLEGRQLAALSRRPTPAEAQSVSRYLQRRNDPRAGYRGVLWTLLNSSEFAINH